MAGRRDAQLPGTAFGNVPGFLALDRRRRVPDIGTERAIRTGGTGGTGGTHIGAARAVVEPAAVVPGGAGPQAFFSATTRPRDSSATRYRSWKRSATCQRSKAASIASGSTGAASPSSPALGEPDHGDGFQAELRGRQQPAVAGDQHAALVDEARHVESELGDRAGDLRHLRVRMRSCIGGVGQQTADRPLLDLRLEIMHLALRDHQTEPRARAHRPAYQAH